MNLRELNSGTPETKQWLNMVCGSCYSAESIYKYKDTPTDLPNPGVSKLYIKNDGKVYTIDSAGVERIVGDGAGDLTDLENKTQNIDLAGTVSNTTQLNGGLKFNNTSTVVLKRRTDTDLQLQGATRSNFTLVGEDVAGIRTSFGMRSGGDGIFMQFDKVANTDPGNNLCIAHQGSGCDVKLFRDGSTYLGNDFEYNEGSHDGKENGVHIQANTASTNPTSGALKVDGGIGVAQDIQVQGNVFVNGSPVSTGAYSSIADKIVDFNTFGTNPESLVSLPPDGIGNPLVLPNKFKKGGHYALRAAGTITCAQNTNCTFYIVLGNPNPPATTYIQGTLPIIGLGPCTAKAWQLDAYVTVREVGGPNTAENIGRMEFRTNINQNNNFFGDSVVRGETVLFNTTDLNAFDLQFQWNTTQTTNSIKCSMFVGNTIFQP
jgi:hypothetical protein